jgi:uncharacterized protein YeaO (DUF488 family)
MSGAVRDTYVAALQHDLVSFEGDVSLVGVVREPTGWFQAAVDENIPELGPPADLLAETKQRAEDFEMQGLCAEGAHNAAWDETAFAARYRTHLDESDAAQRALDRLRGRIEGGETVVLVCFEGEGKRCHRTILRERLEQ